MTSAARIGKDDQRGDWRLAHALTGRILTADGWVDGGLRFAQRITAIEPGPVAADAPVILPGFIDLHVHGGAGADTMAGAAAVRTLARLHAGHGTTSLLATTVTAPLAEVEAALGGVAEVHRKRRTGEARVLGVHLEGPFIAGDKLGAQPPHAIAADRATLDRLLALAPIKVVTLAPEAADAAVIGHLAAQGVRVQLGHTGGTYEQAEAALAAGAAGFTHLYNAMSGLHHRAPGMAGAALANADFAELIPDLIHVHPGAIKLALRAIPRLYCVTDATAAAGMPDGDYRLGELTVTRCLNGVYLPDGTLAGSTLTMDTALRNLLSLGLDLADAAARVSTNAADYLGLNDRGRIVAGAYADLVVLDPSHTVRAVYVEGEPVATAAM